MHFIKDESKISQFLEKFSNLTATSFPDTASTPLCVSQDI